MSSSPPPDFSTAPASARAAATRLFFDVDDTLTWQGALPEVAVSALYRAHEAGLSLVAVTGRSLAWAELLLRLLPLDAAIGETGAACFIKRDGGRVDVLHAEPDAAVRREHARKREEAADDVRARVPAARLALDNMGRVYDVAFDLVEDGPAVSAEDAAQIRGILEEHGLHVAQSSVHINAWFGTFDKAWMVDRYLQEEHGTALDDAAATLVYAGDSKNDGPMFARTPLSVGVENVTPHLDALAARGQAPRYRVAGVGGHGFARLVDTLLAAR